MPRRPSTTSRRPRTSSAAITRAAPSGSSARSRTAKVFLRDRIAWLVERDFGAYGEPATPGRGDGLGKGRIFETEYANSRQMVAWVLHWRQNATVLDPPELAEEVAERLGSSPSKAQRRLRACGVRADGAAGAPRRPHRRTGAPSPRSDRALRPPRDARRDADRVREGRGPPAGRRRHGAAARQRRGATRRHRSAERRHPAAAPTCSTPNCGATRSRSTPSRTATASPAPPACCRSRRRRWSRRSTWSGTTSRRAAWRAPGRRSPRSVTIPPRRARSPPRGGRLGRRPQGQRRDRASPRARDPLLQGERGRVHQARDRAIPARQRAGGAGTSPPTTAAARISATSASTGSRRPKSPRRRSSRARRSRRSPRSRGPGASGSTFPPPTWRGSGSHPSGPRWAREDHTVIEELADGAVVIEGSLRLDGLAAARDPQGRRRARRSRAGVGSRGDRARTPGRRRRHRRQGCLARSAQLPPPER